MKATVYGREMEYTDAQDLARKIRKIQAENQKEYNRLFAPKTSKKKVDPTPEEVIEVVTKVEVVETEKEEVVVNPSEEVKTEEVITETPEEVQEEVQVEVVENSNKKNRRR